MAQRPKPLMPSMREKKRYVLFRVNAQRQQPYDVIMNSIRDSFLGWVGLKGIAASGFAGHRERFDMEKQVGVIRIHPKYVDVLKASFILLQSIGKAQAAVTSQFISGSMIKMPSIKRS